MAAATAAVFPALGKTALAQVAQVFTDHDAQQKRYVYDDVDEFVQHETTPSTHA